MDSISIESTVQVSKRVQSSTSTGRRILLWVASATILAGVLPIALVSVVPNSGRSAAWELTLCIAIAAGLKISTIIAVGEPRLFQFVVWLFAYVFFGLAATSQIRSGVIASTTPGIPARYDSPTAAIVIIGLVCFELGSIVDRRRFIAPGASKSSSLGIHRGRTIALGIFGLVLSTFFVATIGPGAFMSSREILGATIAARWPDLSTSAVIASLAYVPLLVSGQALLHGSHQRRLSGAVNSARRWRLVGVMIMIPVLFIMNPIGNARYTSGTVYASLMGAFGGFATRLRSTVSMIAVVLSLLFVFPIADAFRFSRSGSFGRPGFFTDFIGNGDYDAFWTLANSLIYVESQGYDWGRQFLGVVLFWVPRSVWATKPWDTGILLARFRGYGFTNLSAPLWAELYLSFGIPAVIIGFFLLGRLFNRLDVAGAAAFVGGGFPSIVASVLPFYTIILLRGSLLQATGGLAVLLAANQFVATGRARRSRLGNRERLRSDRG